MYILSYRPIFDCIWLYVDDPLRLYSLNEELKDTNKILVWQSYTFVIGYILGFCSQTIDYHVYCFAYHMNIWFVIYNELNWLKYTSSNANEPK